ncbi:MAG: hypothetical protein JWM04_1957 [Verrucomicrobiales bacterium]|nr:hypothetical protein [Verrucomicrobiales bacterium]
MSLINDALKRAGQNSNKPPEGGGPPPTMHLARTPDNSPFPFIPALLVVIFCLAGLFFYLGIRSKKEKSIADRTATTPQTVPIARTANDSKLSNSANMPKVIGTTVGGSTQKSRIKISTNIVYRTNILQESAAQTNLAATEVEALKKEITAGDATSTTTSNAVVPIGAQEIVLKLQGIFYRQNNPSALINNRTVMKGSVIEGSKVVGIERESVILEKGGTTNVLRMTNY